MAISNEIEKLERRWQQTSGLVFAPLAEAYRKSGLHQRALEVLEQGLALHPEYGPALIVRGRCHLDSGKLDQAEQAFEQALARDPMDPIAIRGIADVFARTSRLPQAVERLQLLVDLDPRNNEARAALDRLVQYVVPDVVIAPEAAAAPAGPVPSPVAEAPAAVVPAPAPAPETSVLEPISLEPMEPPTAEPEPFVIQPTSLVPEEPDETPPAPDPAEFRIESFAVEPLEAPPEPGSESAAEPFGPISWTPAPVEEVPAESPASVPSEPESELGVVFTPVDESLTAPESRPVESEPVSEPVPEVVSETVPAPVEAEALAFEPVDESMPEQEPELVETETVASEPVPEAPEPVVVEAEPEVVAEAAVAEYASAMPPTNEVVPPIAPEQDVPPEPDTVAAEAVPEPLPETSATIESSQPVAETEDPPALIVTESMAELFLRQGHRELALAVYRQLTVRGPVSPRLSEDMQRVEAELVSRAAAPEHRRDYAARVTGGQSVESLLQGILKAEPPAPTSSVLPPAIEPAAGEPTRTTTDPLPLSAVFGDEPVVAPRPESIASEAEPSFDEFFGAVSSPEPAPAGGERNPEAEDLRQFNEWLKGLKR